MTEVLPPEALDALKQLEARDAEVAETVNVEEAKQVLDDATSPEQRASPEEIAAQLLHFYTPVYNNLVSGLSSKAMRRLLNKLIEYPLNTKKYDSTSPAEAQAFAVGLRLLEAKHVLIMSTYAQNIDNLTQEQKEQGESNG